MKLSDYVLDYMKKKDINHVFLISGGNVMHFLESISRDREIGYTCTHHEQAAAMAADAYARITGKPGFLIITSGPGATNAITGVAGAWIDSVPMIVFSGQTAYEQTIKDSGLRQLGVQEINIIDMIKPITKYSTLIKNPEEIKYHLEKAYTIATSGRPGPVWLDIPINIQGSKINPEFLKGFEGLEEKVDNAILKQEVSEVYSLINKSERPVIVAGHGIRLAHAEKEFLELAEFLSMPVLTTRNGNDLIYNNHPLYSGRPGSFGQRYANFTIQNSDLLLSIGSRLSLAVTGWRYDAFARNAKKIVIDIDSAELKKYIIKPDLPINADAKSFISEMLRQKQLYKKSDISKWLEKIIHWKNKYPVVLPEYLKEKDFVNSYYFTDVLSDELDNNDVIVTDMGTSFQCTSQAFKLKKGQRLFTASGLAPMGYGLPGAIGACIGNNKKRVICITGDGGLMMNIQELETIKHNNLPIKLFVYNNKGYATQSETEKSYGWKRLVAVNPESGLGFPDFVKLAKAHGLKAKNIKNHNNLRKNIREVLDYEGPVLCNINLSENQLIAPKQGKFVLSDGTASYPPIEDLAPFLERDELKEEMIIPIE